MNKLISRTVAAAALGVAALGVAALVAQPAFAATTVLASNQALTSDSFGYYFDTAEFDFSSETKPFTLQVNVTFSGSTIPSADLYKLVTTGYEGVTAVSSFASGNTASWLYSIGTFTPGSLQKYVIEVASPVATNVSISTITTPVPEADAVALALAGVGVVGVMARRRRAA